MEEQTVSLKLEIKRILSSLRHCRGLDDRPLTFGHVRKSVSAEVNYGIRFKEHKEAEDFLQRLCSEVEKRLQEVQMKAKCITLKLMVKAKGAPEETAKFLGHGVCDHITKSSSLNMPVSDVTSILREVMSIYKKLKLNPQDLRGVGIQLSRLEPNRSKKMNTALDKFLQRGDASKVQSSYPAPSEYPSSSKQLSIEESIDVNIIQKGTEVKNEKYADYNFEKSVQSTGIDCLPDFDKDVYTALPEYIQLEILRDKGLIRHHFQLKNRNQDLKKAQQNSLNSVISDEEKCNFTLSEIDQSFLSALPCDLKEEIEETALKNRQNKHAVHKIKSSLEGPCEENEWSIMKEILTMDEVRDLVREWVAVEPEPQEKDISMFASILERFVYNHQLENLKITINTLYRSILSKDYNELWKTGYATIIEHVQKAMRKEYGGSIYLDNLFFA